jgi:hypothetical protein
MLLDTGEAGEFCASLAGHILCSATKSILLNFYGTSSTFGALHKLKLNQVGLSPKQYAAGIKPTHSS